MYQTPSFPHPSLPPSFLHIISHSANPFIIDICAHTPLKEGCQCLCILHQRSLQQCLLLVCDLFSHRSHRSFEKCSENKNGDKMELLWKSVTLLKVEIFFAFILFGETNFLVISFQVLKFVSKLSWLLFLPFVPNESSIPKINLTFRCRSPFCLRCSLSAESQCPQGVQATHYHLQEPPAVRGVHEWAPLQRI